MTAAEDQGDALLAELARQTGGDYVAELLPGPVPIGTEFDPTGAEIVDLTDAQIDELLKQLVEPSEVDALLAALERHQRQAGGP
ncbi:MAG: hypothetical protein ACYDC5_04820 [Candidatus Dormibacteria bacterium]